MLQYLPAAIKFLDAALPQQQQQQSGEGNGASPGAASTSTSAPAPSTATATASIAPAPPGTAAPAGCRVLVHCQAGVSRSVAVVAGWLMRRWAGCVLWEEARCGGAGLVVLERHTREHGSSCAGGQVSYWWEEAGCGWGGIAGAGT